MVRPAALPHFPVAFPKERRRLLSLAMRVLLYLALLLAPGLILPFAALG